VRPPAGSAAKLADATTVPTDDSAKLLIATPSSPRSNAHAEMSSFDMAGHIQDDTDLIFADEVIAFTAPVNTSFLKKAV
jgi:hypothetical protein